MESLCRGPRTDRVAPLLLAILLASAAGARAQTIDLERSAFSGGAANVSGGAFALRATIGEAGPVGQVSGGSHTLGKGFWAGFNLLMAVDVPAVSPEAIVTENSLEQNSPNPFRGPTSIAFSVARGAPVRMIVYDVTGRRVATLVDRTHSPGHYRIDWRGNDEWGQGVAPGVYFTRLTIGSWSQTRKMLKLK